MCSRIFECAEELGQTPEDTESECTEQVDNFVSNSPADVSATYEATWQTCLDTTTCEEFDAWVNNIGN